MILSCENALEISLQLFIMIGIMLQTANVRKHYTLLNIVALTFYE